MTSRRRSRRWKCSRSRANSRAFIASTFAFSIVKPASSSASRARAASTQSRSDASPVAGAFKPRFGRIPHASRSDVCSRSHCQLMCGKRRSATYSVSPSIRGLKAPATGIASLCDETKLRSWTNWRSTDMRYELIIYWSRADECFFVEVPELAGCMADGATYQEAVAHANSSSSNGWKPPANSAAPSPSRAAGWLTLEDQEDSEILRPVFLPPCPFLHFPQSIRSRVCITSK